MKKTLVIVVVLLGVFAFGTKAFGGGTSALLDDKCSFHNATFTIPPGKSAKNIRMTLSSSWLPCGGTGTPMRIGGRIMSPLGNVIYYGVKYKDGHTKTLAGNLAGLVLAPGTYTVEVRDGGKQTRASVSYDLGAAAPPAPPPAAAAGGGSGWGTISGDWTDPTVKSNAKITQSGNSMTITNTLQWQGKAVTWSGSGTINGNQVRFKYAYTGYKPAGWENGTMVLTRVSKNSLKGRWTTSSGKYSANIMFIQTRSDDPAALPQQPAQRRTPARVQPRSAPIDRGNCPPHYIYGGPGRCHPPTLPKQDR